MQHEKSSTEEQKHRFPFQVGCFQFFCLHLFISFSRCLNRHQKCLMSYFEIACVTIFPKMLCKSARFFTAWLSSILISHVQNLFDENIFLPFQVQKKLQVCARKESIVFTNNAMITRTSCAREQKKVTCPNAQCVARARENLARSSLCLEHFYSQRTTLTDLPLRVKNTVSYKKWTWGIAL